jgi:hypothetical protein
VLKLQNSQSGTVNNLLEEVRRAEENVARERKKAASEVGRSLDRVDGGVAQRVAFCSCAGGALCSTVETSLNACAPERVLEVVAY